MKQILNINLGGYPVTIDTDAYDHLSKYLDAIELHFQESDAADEILSDIETRMAELFKENIHPRTIVTMPDVKSAIDIMGTPEMFGAEAIDEDEEPVSAQAGEKKKPKSKSGFNPGKRLFRDPDNKTIGGVSAGLAAYLGVEDPIWIRIAFVLFTVAGFASVPIYIILWIVMPLAKTSADRLAMKGEPINVESIASSVVEELEHFSDRINDQFGHSKKKSGNERSSRKSRRRERRKNRNNHRDKKRKNFLVGLGSILSTVILSVSRGARPLLRILGTVLIFVLLAIWISVVVTSVLGISRADFFFPTNTLVFSIGVGSLFLLVGAPIIGLIMSVLRVIFKKDISRNWRWGLFGIWFLGIGGLASTAGHVSNFYNQTATYRQVVPIIVAKEKPLHVRFKNESLASNDARNMHLRFNHDAVKFDWNEVDLKIEPSQEKEYQLVLVQVARGRNQQDAEQGARKFEYQPIVSENTLELSSRFFIPKGERFRAQRVHLILYVPIGEKLIMDKGLDDLDLHFSRRKLGQEMVMTTDGLEPTDKLKDNPQESLSTGTQIFSLKDFSAIEVFGPVSLNIRQGAPFRVKARGIQEGDPVSLQVDNKKLTILAEGNKDMEVYITMPSLASLTAKDTRDILISDMEGEEMVLDFQGNMVVKLRAKLAKITANLDGQTKLKLMGQATELKADLQGSSIIQGSGFQVSKADVNVKGQASADLRVNGDLKHY